jgi:hypothetical protein
MRHTTNPSAHSINVLVAFRAMLSKINASPEHSTNVGMSLIKTFLHNCIDKWTAMEKHTLTRLMSIFFRDFLSSVRISFPQFTILNFLNLFLINLFD